MKEESRDPDQLHYHYNREERMAGLPDHVGRKSGKGFLRGNRSLAITLIDVALLVILVIVFSVVIRLRGDTTVLPGYSITARAVEYGDRVLVSVKAKAGEDHPGEEQVRIKIGYKTEGGAKEIIGFLPAEKGSEQVYREALDLNKGQERVFIEFFTAGASGSTTAKIKSE